VGGGAVNWPSGTLLAQSALSGVFIGGLYGLLGLGLGLTWGLLHVINLAHFGLAFLAAYLCYQLAGSGGVDPLATLALIVPLFFALGVAMHWLLVRFRVSPLNSLLATFGITAIIEAGIQAVWTADFRKLESVYAGRKWQVGELFVPLPELLTLLVAFGLSFGIWAAMRYTHLGRVLRALAEVGAQSPPTAALDDFRRARFLESSSPAQLDVLKTAWRVIAKFHATQNDFRRAFELAREFGESPKLPKVSTAASVEELDKNSMSNPTNYDAGVALYQKQTQEKKIDDALVTAQRFTAQSDMPPYFHFLEAESWATKGDWERAWVAWQAFDAAKRR
jgi:hypothetical protein